MKIVLSPAKKMIVHNDDFTYRQKPQYEQEAKQLYNLLKDLSFEELKEVYQCSNRLVRENQERLKHFSFTQNLSPAVFSYVGLAYQHLSADVMTETQLEYIEKHLRILSGFYGILRPFDGISPYRLEMQSTIQGKDLYSFWGRKLYDALMDEDHTIVNLASKEYSKCIEPYLEEKDHYLTIVFGELQKGKVIQKGTMAKIARGNMVYWMSENQIEKVEDIKKFSIQYTYTENLSNANEYVFLKD